ncbi:MAG TPA: hypothetical protein VLH36_12260 [Steroidobacteraceae bacterium]|nr:hypothetical protein [Steroidobacteraceae bacterium]
MAKTQSRGTCLFCGGEKPKSAMSRHLVACDRRGRGDEERLPVVVEGAWAPAYWLHLEVKPQATLGDLDRFLRRTWLECCGHMSSFEIGDRRFESATFDFDGSDGESMEIAVGRVLVPGASARYVYDFGSSTELKIRTLAPRPGKPSGEKVRLVARNTAPEIPCKRGHGDATHVCTFCGRPLCPACVTDHQCEPEGLLPVVNSPRAGTCAYGAV